MTPQQIEAMKLALDALENYAWHGEACPQHPTYSEPKNYPKCTCGYDNAITAIKEALAEHAMQEVQRLGQEIEQEPTVEQIEAAIEAWFNNFKSTTYQKRMRAALKAANSIKE